MNQLFDAHEPTWLDPSSLGYTGQHSPPRWYAALHTITGLRPPKSVYGLRRQGWQDALQTVHDIIAREMAITR